MGYIDLSGKRFGRLTVGSRKGSDKHKKATWNCICDCGNETIVDSGCLKSGNTSSCGCLRKDMVREKYTTHGHKKDRKITSEYNTWYGLLKRCRNPNCKQYQDYGGRGITVCDRWLHSFENFLADMGEKPTPKHSIDRINVNGNYEPNNCRWATMTEQAQNKRRAITNLSGVMGVTWNKRDKRWISNITVNGTVIRFGSFKDFEEAKQARIQGEIKYWNKLPS